MEIAGYPVMGWLMLFGGLGMAGWVTGVLLTWLLTLRWNGQEPSEDNWLIRYRWVVAVAFAVFYFVLLGNAVDWQLEAHD